MLGLGWLDPCMESYDKPRQHIIKRRHRFFNKAPHKNFPCGSAGKDSPCDVEELGLIPGLGRYPGEGKGYPLQYSGLYSLWGRKQSNTTEQLSLSFHLQKLSILQSTDKIINRYYYY